jgi:hypothetical protein
VRGMNAKGQVHIADPAFGNYLEPVSQFEAEWKGGIAFVVTR